MGIKNQGKIGDLFENGVRQFNNRTGGATVVGGAYVLDHSLGETESSSIDNGMGNLVAVSTANIALCPNIVIATEVVADNAVVNCAVGEGILVQALIEGTTDVPIQHPCKPVDATAYMVKATVLTDRWYLKPLAAQASNSAVLTACILYSGGKF